mgnify:FL=1
MCVTIELCSGYIKDGDYLFYEFDLVKILFDNIVQLSVSVYFITKSLEKQAGGHGYHN